MKVFLASSRESLGDMHKIAFLLESLGHIPLTWDSPEAFLPGTYTLSGIIDISRVVDAAIFIFAEDDRIWYRTSELRQPRDNVLVEYGIFAGILGPERALICRKGGPKTPSDLDGIVHIDISDQKIESARAHIEPWIRRARTATRLVLPSSVCPGIRQNRR
jgi:predicted nucleotide-binding protein